MRPDWSLRRRLASAPDSLPWQALQYALARWDGGADACDDPPPVPPTIRFDRKIRVGIALHALRAGGSERTLLEVAAAFDPDRVVPRVSVESGGLQVPFEDTAARLHARGVPILPSSQADPVDVAIRVGPGAPSPAVAPVVLSFVCSPSEAARRDLQEWPRGARPVAASRGCARMAEMALSIDPGSVPVVWNGAA